MKNIDKYIESNLINIALSLMRNWPDEQSDVKCRKKRDKTEDALSSLLPWIWFTFILDMDTVCTLSGIDFTFKNKYYLAKVPCQRSILGDEG